MSIHNFFNPVPKEPPTPTHNYLYAITILVCMVLFGLSLTSCSTGLQEPASPIGEDCGPVLCCTGTTATYGPVCNPTHYDDYDWYTYDGNVPCDRCEEFMDIKLKWWLGLNKGEDRGFTESNFYDYFKCD